MTRTKLIALRLDDEEYGRIQRAANAENKGLSEWIRNRCAEAISIPRSDNSSTQVVDMGWLIPLAKVQKLSEVDGSEAMILFKSYLAGRTFSKPKDWDRWTLAVRASWLDERLPLGGSVHDAPQASKPIAPIGRKLSAVELIASIPGLRIGA